MPLLWFSLLIGVFFSYYHFECTYYPLKNNTFRFIWILAIPAVTVFLYYFYDKFIFYLKKYILSLDKIEKWYLITAIIVILIGIPCIYQITNVFYQVKAKPDAQYIKINGKDVNIEDFRILY